MKADLSAREAALLATIAIGTIVVSWIVVCYAAGLGAGLAVRAYSWVAP